MPEMTSTDVVGSLSTDEAPSAGQTLFDLSTKVILISGANRGNGLAMALGLKRANAKIVRIDRVFDSSIDTDDREFDLTSFSKIPELVTSIVARYGRIDGLINNAGVSLASEDPYSDLNVYNSTIGINTTAAFWLCAQICPVMASGGGGSIVNITSLGAELGFPNNPSYQMSKAALRQLTKAVARDWGEQGIRANNICPGYIRTAMTEKSYQDPVLRAERTKRTFLRRWGEPADLVGPAIFLMSQASTYITGADIHVDGGWTANGL